MSQNAQLLERRLAVVPNGIPMVTTATVTSASDATLIDREGRELIDFAGGIGVMNVGHCHKDVVRAIQDQAEKLLHACFHIATYESYVALCEKLAELFPHGDHTKVLLVNSGAEAVENAVKIARMATKRPAVICYSDAFHGRTMMCMTLTSKIRYQRGCGPFAPEVYRLPFPNFYRYGEGLNEADFVKRELYRFRETLENTVAPESVAAVILETIQGEGGFVPVPRDYLIGLRKICDENGILLILDEVQSGFCRTGKWAAYEHYGVVPDLSTWAKSMGGGMPIGAVIGRADVMDGSGPGTVGGTYGGNPVACAASLATIEVMKREQLGARADEIGKLTREHFTKLQHEFPAVVGDIRGLGAMIGVELVIDGDPLQPATALTAEVVKRCLARGVLIIPAGIHGNVIRILSPLVITNQQLEQGLEIVCDEIRKQITEAS